ncbi:MAG TPA: HAMP domain-containing sensor histidine kinase [Burkholderiaceae bacterium]
MNDEDQEQPDLFLFLASTAHDMKNSISVLSGTLEGLLADAPDKTAAAFPSMAHMLYETRRLNNNLIQLLALYKEVGKPAYPFDPQQQSVQDTIEQVLAQNRVLLDCKNITIGTDFDPSLLWVYDEDLVLGVIGHAINNAVHYTQDKIALIVREHEGMLELRVEDNGRGYPAAMLERGNEQTGAWTRGVNFASNSTALGLHFSAAAATMHKHRGVTGRIALENGGTFGGGCFVLRLP